MKSLRLVWMLAALLVPGRVLSFDTVDHYNMTLKVLRKQHRPSVTGTGEDLKFTNSQAKSLASCVRQVDKFELLEPSNHFDNETIYDSSKIVIDATNRALTCLTSDAYGDCKGSPGLGVLTPPCDSPTWHIAQAIHAIQDFYSHSNFLSLYCREGACSPRTLKDVYGWTLGVDILPDPLRSDQFCVISDPGLPLAPQNVPKYRIGRKVDGKPKLTSGYFSIAEAFANAGSCGSCSESPVLPAPGKCQHGLGVPPQVTCPGFLTCSEDCRGINRDNPCERSAQSSCASFLCWHQEVEHELGKAAAEKATTEYIEEVIIDQILSQSIDTAPVALCRLFGLDDSDCLQCSDRFCDNGDGTITDSSTGLMWEKKDMSGGIHDLGNQYSWSSSGSAADGTAFTMFLASLNTPPCFAGHCDWRLPKSAGTAERPSGEAAELESIVAPYPCGTPPCVPPIFNQACSPGCTVLSCSCTQSFYYWSASSDNFWNWSYPDGNNPNAWFVNFIDGSLAVGGPKTHDGFRARAVRDGP